MMNRHSPSKYEGVGAQRPPFIDAVLNAPHSFAHFRATEIREQLKHLDFHVGQMGNGRAAKHSELQKGSAGYEAVGWDR